MSVAELRLYLAAEHRIFRSGYVAEKTPSAGVSIFDIVSSELIDSNSGQRHVLLTKVGTLLSTSIVTNVYIYVYLKALSMLSSFSMYMSMSMSLQVSMSISQDIVAYVDVSVNVNINVKVFEERQLNGWETFFVTDAVRRVYRTAQPLLKLEIRIKGTFQTR